MTKTMWRTACVVASAVVLSSLPSAVTAQTEAELDTAKTQLSELESRVRSQEAAVARLLPQVREQASVVADHADAVQDIRFRLWQTQARLDQTRADLAGVRDRIALRARSLYVRGPLGWLDALLGAGSFRDLIIRTEYAAHVMSEDAELAGAAEDLAAGLEDDRAAHDTLLRSELRAQHALEVRKNELQAVYGDQKHLLDELARSRAETLQLVTDLRGKLQAERLAAAAQVAGKGMPITYGEWADAFLTALGAPVTDANRTAVVAWQTAEGTMATWNPLATTLPMPGATIFNDHGVKNFVSMEQGIEASILTLRRPGHGYDRIIAALMDGSDAMAVARAINASNWCRGCTNGRYVIGLIPVVDGS